MNGNIPAYVGTYTNGRNEGIYAVGLDRKTGRLGKPVAVAGLENPSYLTISRNGKYLYAVLETDTYGGYPGGAVAALAIDNPSGELRLLNVQQVYGGSPCHISTDYHNKVLFVANYSDGKVTVFSINPDGSIGPLASQICHRGSGPDLSRQEGPHAHYAALTPDERYLCAADLGIDRIMVYQLNCDNGPAFLVEAGHIIVKPGSGPRHMEFHPDGKFAYLLNELTSDILVTEYLPEDCIFKPCQTISTLPPDFSGISIGAAIHISPDGNYLFASNRGHNSIATFKICRMTGKLDPVYLSSTHGEIPRDFAIDPTGKYLLAANQDSNTIVPFLIADGSGKLERSGDPACIPTPVCVKFNPWNLMGH